VRNFIKDWFVSANVHGKGNIVVFESLDGRRKSIRLKSALSGLKIRGKSNSVIIRNSSDDQRLKHSFPSGLTLTIRGNDNTVIIDGARFVRSSITLVGDKNHFRMAPTADPVRDAQFWLADGGSITIGRNFGPQERLKVVVDNDAERKHQLLIGDDVLTAVDTVIRTSDGHSLVDRITGHPVNEPQDIIIGNRCWIGTRCVLLKGTVLPNGCVVGACSLVKDRFAEENLLIAGSPARILRRGIAWDARPYGELLRDIKEDRKLC
jgi:acetyltransferase-like isoleucine patch superfamily enzyme